ncbi:MAG: PIN domain-containing protein [Candidatus Pacearchaeota archaeon]
MRYFIDSSAWIEYLRGSKKGERVHKILNSDSQVFTLPLNISEVISKTDVQEAIQE